jgi:hypothetical protein
MKTIHPFRGVGKNAKLVKIHHIEGCNFPLMGDCTKKRGMRQCHTVALRDFPPKEEVLGPSAQKTSNYMSFTCNNDNIFDVEGERDQRVLCCYSGKV